MLSKMQYEKSAESSSVKCVLTENDIGNDLQPMREHDTGQGKV